MVSEEWVASEVLKVYPKASVEATDLHGSGDHFHVRIVSDEFVGVRPLQRQMPVLKHFKEYIENNSVHALDLKRMTPEQSLKMGNTTFDPHSGKQEFFGIHVRRPNKK